MIEITPLLGESLRFFAPRPVARPRHWPLRQCTCVLDTSAGSTTNKHCPPANGVPLVRAVRQCPACPPHGGYRMPRPAADAACPAPRDAVCPRRRRPARCRMSAPASPRRCRRRRWLALALHLTSASAQRKVLLTYVAERVCAAARAGAAEPGWRDAASFTIPLYCQALPHTWQQHFFAVSADGNQETSSVMAQSTPL
jgi:hypothetical protein